MINKILRQTGLIVLPLCSTYNEKFLKILNLVKKQLLINFNTFKVCVYSCLNVKNKYIFYYHVCSLTTYLNSFVLILQVCKLSLILWFKVMFLANNNNNNKNQNLVHTLQKYWPVYYESTIFCGLTAYPYLSYVSLSFSPPCNYAFKKTFYSIFFLCYSITLTCT